jgi:hypothetical protein
MRNMVITKILVCRLQYSQKSFELLCPNGQTVLKRSASYIPLNPVGTLSNDSAIHTFEYDAWLEPRSV